MSIRWLGHVTINGITFQKGDNGKQFFYDVETNDVGYSIIRPHISDSVLPGATPPKDGRCHIPYWFAYAQRGQALHPLNLLYGELDGTESKDPLADLTDSGYDDPPVRLLSAIAEYINQGIDPWKLERIRTERSQDEYL